MIHYNNEYTFKLLFMNLDYKSPKYLKYKLSAFEVFCCE